MGYLVVSQCYQTLEDAQAMAASFSSGYQVVACSATSPFVELTADQKAQMFQNGMELGAAVSVVLVIAWAFTAMRRAL